ncbi:protein DpdJ [Mycolicibacterium elephantis]|uniref:protein DpdJ n=1 Tax=Mycolicibacterium elephantis TaxID=81858 RepID=UPI003A86D5EB
MDLLESHEDPLLSWGVVDGGLSEDEFQNLIRDWGLENDPFSDVDAIIDELIEHGLVFHDEAVDPPRWRTRTAESLRLLSRLRQIFPSTADASNAWRRGTPLVADFRYLRRPRAYPKRDVEWTATLDGLDDPSGAVTRSLEGLTPSRGGKPLQLSGFQVRATQQILASLKSGTCRGVVVGAGTGSGKTLAFYLPAYAYIAALRDGSTWTRGLAIYPRNELLKDQFSSAFESARRADDLFIFQMGRKLRIGAFYGASPHTASSLDNPYSQWLKTPQGYLCPYLTCPGADASGCGGELHWPHEAVKRGDELLACSSCNTQFGEDTIVITRQRMRSVPPDIVFSTTEMLNRTLPDLAMGSVLGIGVPDAKRPRLMLLDEIHTYSGGTGAQTAMVLRRWRHRINSPVTFVGLSATLVDAAGYFSDMVGLDRDSVVSVEPAPEELTYEGAEYLVAARSDPTTGGSVLSTTIQSAMLLTRVLDAPSHAKSQGAFGTKTFVFTDDLDVTNRLYYDLLDAEGQRLANNSRAVPAGKAPLAALRNPALGGGVSRRVAGQSWDLPAQLGHPIDDSGRLNIGRTSSQDVGVDSGAQLIVATASLEVGFDDPGVGAVIQHKAPRDIAQFVQRKGRAGRPRGMRPITLVVLSDFGRDRAAYEAWDSLFEPVLPKRTLPIRNRAVLRMHAAQSLLEWAAVKVRASNPSANLWLGLKEAPTGQYAGNTAELQSAVVDQLERLLTDPVAQNDLASWLRRSLLISSSDVNEILWHPPRPVLLGAVPALIRRLQTRFSVANPSGLVANIDLVSDHPLPDYFPGTLFGELSLSEVDVYVPSQLSRSTEPTIEPMGVAQMMREYAPGRVSRRFASRNSTHRHWIPITGDHPEETKEVSDFIHDFEIASTPKVIHRNRIGRYELVRPHRIDLTLVPDGIRDASNAQITWRSQFVEEGQGISVRLPSTDRLGSLISEATFFLHAQSNWVRTHRLAVESDATLRLDDGSERRSRIRFTHQGSPAGVGATFDVDALRLRIGLPELNAEDITGDPGIRSAWFRHVVTTDEALLVHGNIFQLGWLHQAVETMLILEASERDVSLSEAHAQVRNNFVDRLNSTLEVLFQRSGLDLGNSEIDTAPGKLSQTLSQLVSIPDVATRLDALVAELWQPSTVDLLAWVRTRLLATIGQSAFAAARVLCPDHDPEGLYVDVEPGVDVDGSPRTGEVWLSEPTVGGGGFLEALAMRVQSEPRRFLRLMWAAIQPGSAETLDRQLRWIIPRLGTDAALVDAVSQYRSAATQEGRISALTQVRNAIGRIPIRGDEHVLVSNLANRVLRPGSSNATDAALAALQRGWEELEQRLRIEISARTWAFLASASSAHDQALGITEGVDRRQRRIDLFLSLLWPTGWRIRSEALKSWNPFDESVDPLPELLREITPSGSPVVLLDDAAATERIRAILADGDQVRVQGSSTELERMSTLIAELVSEPVESEWLNLNPRVVEVESSLAGYTLVTLETSEGFR